MFFISSLPSSISSSSSNIWKRGSLNDFLFIHFSNAMSKVGNKIRLDIIAISNVTDDSKPMALVQPKCEAVNTPNPKNKIILE